MARRWRNGQKVAQWPEGGTQGQRAQRPECGKKTAFSQCFATTAEE